jgi:RNA polymerase sigma-70 factor (ECF subfamily)
MDPPEREAADPARVRSSSAQSQIVNEFSQFYRDQMLSLISFLLYQGASGHDAADIAQYAMSEAFNHWKEISFPKAWVRTVATRAFIRRSTELRRELLNDDIIDVSAAKSGGGEIDALIVKHTIVAAMRSLPPRQRQVLAWYLDGFKPSEIAKELGIEPGAVRTALKNARRSVAAELMGSQENSSG